MSRRPSTDTAALRTAYRRLDGADPTGGITIDGRAAAADAEAARTDAALRRVFQPVAAPATLAGRVAGEVARERAASGWRSRPAWAMTLAAAAVLLATAVLAAPDGGTIGERARRVGDWMRSVMGIGAHIGEGDDQPGVGPAGSDREAFYWVPGMGILPLRPDAVVAARPVTLTIDSDDVVIEGLVADARGIVLVARSNSTFDGWRWLFFRDTRLGRQTRMDGCAVWSGTGGASRCRYGPLRRDELRRGVARFGVPATAPGSDRYFTSLPSALIWPGLSRPEGALQPDDLAFLRSLDAVEVPLITVASGALTPARRLGPEQVGGGLRMQAWAVDPRPGDLAVRIEPVGLPATDALWFTPASGASRRIPFAAGIAAELAPIGLALPSGPTVHPYGGFVHAAPPASHDIPTGHALRERDDNEEVDDLLPSLPMTVLFDVTSRAVAGARLTLAPLLLAVDADDRVADVPLVGPNSAAVAVDTRAATISWESMQSLRADSADPDAYPYRTTLRLAREALPAGIAIYDRPPSAAVRGETRTGRYPQMVLHWSDGAADGRQLVDLTVGMGIPSSPASGAGQACLGTHSHSVDGPVTGPSPAMRFEASVTDPVPPRWTLCLSRPIFQILGRWTFPLSPP